MVYSQLHSGIEYCLSTAAQSFVPNSSYSIDDNELKGISSGYDRQTLHRLNRELGRTIQRQLKAIPSPDSKTNKDLLLYQRRKRKALRSKKNADARNNLASLNTPLVMNIAKQFQGKGLSLEDLMGEGYIGLAIAIERYDPDYKPQKYPDGIEFATYASHWIKQSIRKALLDEKRRNQNIPYNVCSKANKIIDVITMLEEELGQEPTDIEVAERFNETNYPDKRNSQINADHVKAIKISRRFEGDVSEEYHLDPIRADYCTPDFIAAQKDHHQAILQILECHLDERERRIITLRYGLNGQDPLTLREIGKNLGLTRERVRQIQAKGLKKLKPHMTELDTA